MQARFEYWQKYPPSHLLLRSIAIWAGAIERPPDPTAPRLTLAELRGQYPDGIRAEHIAG